MIKLGISVALEKKLREGKAGVQEILNLIDAARTKKESKQSEPDVKGLGYKDILGLFHLACQSYGKTLLYPPRPSPAYVGKIVRRANELGMDNEYTTNIVRAACATYPRRTGFSVDFLVHYGPNLAVDEGNKVLGVRGDAPNSSTRPIFTGRSDGGDW